MQRVDSGKAPATVSSKTGGPILPGAILGVLGSGQLGRMFAIKARRMGYRVHTYSPFYDTPTGQVADREICAPYDDLDQVRKFAEAVDAVTFEFENVPADTAAACADRAIVRPHGSVLHTTQNRLREKRFLKQSGFPHVPFEEVRSLDELKQALEKLGAPAVLKSAGWGYDGKGQAKIERIEDAQQAWETVGVDEAILEAFVDFAHEASVVGARGVDGAFAHFGLLENIHRNHILDITLAPARIDPSVETEAVEIARGILEALDVVGVLCVEFFVAHDGKLMVNEMAPRPHNSGHITFDNCITSQFEQQLRAVCALPLGSPRRLCPGAMANLLGDLWQKGEPDWERAIALPDIKLHLYGKSEARPGRKMGHLAALADDIETAHQHVLNARDALR